MYKVLLIDDEQASRQAAGEVLSSLGHSVVGASASEAMSMLDSQRFDVVVASKPRAQMRPDLIERPPTPPALVVLPTPFAPRDVARAIGELEERDRVKQELARARESLERAATSEIVGNSPAMQRVLSKIAAVGDSDAPVLLTGESGTGKDLLARTIHARSSRRSKPFVAVNCAAFPETLLEAELFGHERGAFTGALQRREGRFKAADGGTLFLDEVNGLSLAAQAKLLRVLQDGSFQPIGTNTTLNVDVRLVSATNRNLKGLVAQGRFREDLYYRVKVLDIEVPPLRDRRGDIPLLAQHFLRKYGRPGREPPSLSPRAWAALSHYPFPGNIRELEHAIQHALVLSRGREIDLEDLPQDISPETQGEVAPRSEADIRPLAIALREFEREYLVRALRAAGGNKTRAARLLGISRKNLWHKLTRGAGTDVEPDATGDEPPADDEWRQSDPDDEDDAQSAAGGGRRRAARSVG